MFANLDVLANVEKAPLQTVLFCGEVMPMKQLNYWINQYPNVTFGNLYGPTECTEACTYYNINRTFSDDEVLPIGKACENSDAMVLDENNSLITEAGKIGELCMRGTCLSNGYYGDEIKTKEVFVQNPLNNNYQELIYKTGDLVCYNEYGELVYVCRKDFQIKIRGYRVELGEIEAAVSAIDKITYNCCLFDSKKEAIILVYTGDISPQELKDRLSKKLQDYMIPSEYHQRETMLFNLNGKVDRKALGNLYLSK
jgi:non-ribosomal peptide synthetase component F